MKRITITIDFPDELQNLIKVDCHTVEHILLPEEPKQETVETVFPKDNEYQVVAQSKKKTNKPTGVPEAMSNLHKYAKRGQKPKPIPEEPEKKYLMSTTRDIIIKEGFCLPLPGIQATKNKFIASGVYFKGRLNEAKKLYADYCEKTAKDNIDLILTWESWLTHEWTTIQK
jgi:hypothetical protein